MGYNNSPKWSKLNLIFSYVLVENSVITNLFLFLFTISFVLFYLDNFKLSSIHSIRYFQIFSFIGILFIFILHILDMTNLMNIICYVNDKDINLHGHISVDKEAGKAIGQGLSTIGSQIGLGVTMVGVSTAVGKVITKSSIPPMQKAGVVVGGAIVGGLGHSIISTLNRNKVISETALSTASASTGFNGNLSKLLDNSHNSPLQDLLFQLEAMNYVCLGLIYILMLQLVFKFYFKDNINLNWSKLLGSNFNDRLQYYLNKIIKLNKKMSTIYIWIILIILIFGLSISAYACHDMYINIDKFIAVHNNIKGK